METVTLLTESVKNGVYVCEHKTYTLKEFEKMLKYENSGGNKSVRKFRKRNLKRRVKSN